MLWMEDIEQEGQEGNIQQEADQLGTVEEIDGVELYLSSLVGLTTPYSMNIRGHINKKAVKNHKIFFRYSLIYLLPFVYIILLPFTIYCVSILCNTNSLIQ